MNSAGGNQYAYVIETWDMLSRRWSWISGESDVVGVTAGRGVEDDVPVPVDPRGFARATLDAYLDYMVVARPAKAEYFLYEDSEDTRWRIHVWDVPLTGYDERSPVPSPGSRVRSGYALAMLAEGGRPHSTVMLPNGVVRDRLRRKQDALLREERDPGSG